MRYLASFFVLALIAVGLTGCAIVPSAVVGAAFSPLVQPVVDRALVFGHAEWLDPAGTQAVKEFDKPNAR